MSLFFLSSFLAKKIYFRNKVPIQTDRVTYQFELEHSFVRTIKLQTIKLDCHPSFDIQRTKKYSIEILSFLYFLVWKTDQMILEDVMQIDPVFLEEVLGIGLFTQFTICKCTAHFELRISCYKLTHVG